MVMKICNERDCPIKVPAGVKRCPKHTRERDRKRGTPTQRGYGQEHRTRFREGVLARNPICVLCLRRPATEADHYPRSRDELVELGLDPNDPRFGRGLCHPCHSKETAAHQPGGFADPLRM